MRNAPYIIIFFILVFTSSATAQDILSNDENARDFVSMILPYNLDFVRNHIEVEFDSNDRAFFEDYPNAIYDLPDHANTIHDLTHEAYKDFITFPLVHSNKFYVFYGAYPNKQYLLQKITPYSAFGLNNPALERYARLPFYEKEDDIYLWSPDTPYWYSEYSVNGKPLPFRTYFIVHITSTDKSHTNVEIIEDDPVVNLGKRLTVDAHGVLHYFDIRNVSPTTRDREYLLYCINQFIERQIPDRHVFNCLSEEELTKLKQEEQKRLQTEEEARKEWGR